MKHRNFTSLVLLSGALAFPAYAEKVKLEQLPSELQDKIRAQVGNNRVEDIDRNSRDGRTIYEVAFKDNGQHREIQIEHNDSAGTAPADARDAGPISQKIRYEQLPDNVKRVADSYTQGSEINDIDRRTKDGRTVYEIGYKRNDGSAQQELLLSENGQVLSSSSASANDNSTSAAASSSSSGRQPNYRGVIPGQRSNNEVARLRTIQYDQLPATVRSVSDSRLSDGHVSQVQRVLQNGSISYQIDFKKEDGRSQQLVVSEDGRVLRDQFISATNVGSPGGVQWGNSSSATATTSSSTSPANLTAPAQLLSAQEINRDQMPVAVARTVRGYTTTSNIEEVHRGTWNGQQVYQVSYRENNNQLVRLQLDSNGQVIFDPRNSNATTPAQGLLNNIGRLFDNN
jgi:uncharacterized membrane protein YkoI